MRSGKFSVQPSFLLPPKQDLLEEPCKIFRTPAGGTIQIVHGNLFNQHAEAWGNPWNSNRFTGFLGWLHTKGGVSGAMKKVTGDAPFRELAQAGVLPFGAVHFTEGGEKREHLKGIYHTATMAYPAGSNAEWTGKAATALCNDAEHRKIRSIATPLIGAGHGDDSEVGALEAIFNAAAASNFTGVFTIIVRKDEKTIELGSGTEKME